MSVREEPAAVVGKAYGLCLWLLPKVEKIPRSYKFTVGERLVSESLSLLLSLVEAAYSRTKEAALARAVTHTNAVRYLLRLSKDLRLIPLSSWEFAAEKVDEIGRMVGGWRRAKGEPGA
jgi:hypothetical protein